MTDQLTDFYKATLEAINMAACYANKETPETRERALERIGEMAREAISNKHQKERYISYACPICAGTLMESIEQQVAEAQRDMRDAAVKVCRDITNDWGNCGDILSLQAGEYLIEVIATLPIIGEDK